MENSPFQGLASQAAASASNLESSPNTNPSDNQVSKESLNTETTEAPKELTDLDKLERFRFQGKEWTLKDLRSAYMMKQDYSRKTAELAETRKYTDNFEADLKSVIEDPTLLDNMRAVYPANYVQVAERILARLNPESSKVSSSPSTQTQTNPELLAIQKELNSLKTTLSSYEKEKHEAQVAKAEAWLDKTYDTLGKKYPHAHTEVVTARAAFLKEQGHDITEKVLENIFREVNKTMQDKYVKSTQTKISGQLNANLAGKDTGAGGGIPGAPAVKPKTMREAKEAALDYFTQRQTR